MLNQDKVIHSVVYRKEMVIPVFSCAGICLSLSSLYWEVCVHQNLREGWLSSCICIRVSFALTLCVIWGGLFFFSFQF